MGDLVGNLGDPRLPYDYSKREYGTVPMDTKRQPFRWLSEVAYKNTHRIVARGYDTTELVEQGYGMVDILFVDYQSRVPLVEEEQMLSYIMILALEDGLSLPAMLARISARTKTFLTQACGTAILAFGHAYGAYSAFGNRVLKALEKAKKDGKSPAQAAEELVRKHRGDPSLGVSELCLKDPAARRLIARAKTLGVAGEYLAFLEEMASAARKISPTPVDVDMLGATAAAMMDLGFSPEAAWAIIAVTRSFGAGAHYIEEVEREGYTRLGEELTPPEWYDGPAERPVPPLTDRDKLARPAQSQTVAEWKRNFGERQKLHASGFAIVEPVEDPSKKTGVDKVGKK